MFLFIYNRGNTALRVREHKVLGPYVEGLTKLVVGSYEVTNTCMVCGRAVVIAILHVYKQTNCNANVPTICTIAFHKLL